MKNLVSVYGVNAVSFLVNFASVFVYLRLAGFAGYGSYSTYLIMMAIMFTLEISMIRVAQSIHKNTTLQTGKSSAAASAEKFLNCYPILLLALAPCVLLSNYVFPPDKLTGLSGKFVMAVAMVESGLGSPANVLVFRLSAHNRFAEVYLWRLFGTLLRHFLALSVLMFTGSSYYAVAIIMLKGAIFGAITLYYTKIRTQHPISEKSGVKVSDFMMLGGIFSSAFVMMAVKEFPSSFVYRHFDQNFFGTYRTMYDLINPIWFLGTIFPSMLYSYFLTNAAHHDPIAASSKFEPLGLCLALLHLCFGLTVMVGMCLEIEYYGHIFSQTPYSFGLVAGICILGYNNFLIEAAYAFRLAKVTLIITLVGVLFVALILALFPSKSGIEIGVAWLAGQIVVLTGLKYALLRNALVLRRSSLLDVFVLPIPIAGMTLLQIWAPNRWMLILCIFALALSSAGLVAQVFQLYNVRKRQSRV